MITKILKTNTGKISVSMPEYLNEIRLEQLMAMQAAENLSDLQAVSLLSGVALEELQNIRSADELAPFSTQVLGIAHQITHLYNSDAIPKKVTFIINDRPVTVGVIKNLSVEPAGAFMAAREVIADEIARHVKLYGEDGWQANFNPSLQACAQVLAQYFYCRVTGNKYNEYAAADFEQQVKQLPVTEALPIHTNRTPTAGTGIILKIMTSIEHQQIKGITIKHIVVTIISTASIVALVMTSYLQLKNDIHDVTVAQENQARINEIRLKVLEGEVAVLQTEVEQLKKVTAKVK